MSSGVRSYEFHKTTSQDSVQLFFRARGGVTVALAARNFWPPGRGGSGWRRAGNRIGAVRVTAHTRLSGATESASTLGYCTHHDDRHV